MSPRQVSFDSEAVYGGGSVKWFLAGERFPAAPACFLGVLSLALVSSSRDYGSIHHIPLSRRCFGLELPLT